MKQVGILTLQFSNNYGGLLQTYALSKTLQKLGYKPVIFNRCPLYSQKTVFSKVKNNILSGILHSSFVKFRNDFLPNTSIVIDTLEKAKLEVESYDYMVVGSDQVWRLEYTYNEGLELNMFFDFVPDRIPKISYAASFGKDSFEGDSFVTQEVKTLLKRFNTISVREDSAVSLCEKLFGIDAVHTLDPTLLLDALDYEEIICKYEGTSKLDEKFISYYLLDYSQEKKDMVKKVAEHFGTGIKNIYRESSEEFSLKKHWFPREKFIYPSFGNWLLGIKNSEFVVADSFHGIVFSIIYNKQFACIANKSRGVARMKSLLTQFGLENRIVYDTGSVDTVLNLPLIDYEVVNTKINILRQKSIDFLTDSLSKNNSNVM